MFPSSTEARARSPLAKQYDFPVDCGPCPAQGGAPLEPPQGLLTLSLKIADSNQLEEHVHSRRQALPRRPNRLAPLSAFAARPSPPSPPALDLLRVYLPPSHVPTVHVKSPFRHQTLGTPPRRPYALAQAARPHTGTPTSPPPALSSIDVVRHRARPAVDQGQSGSRSGCDRTRNEADGS